MKKLLVKISLLSVFVILMLTVPSIYVHEGVHWVAGSINPWEDPIGFHVLDSYCLSQGYYGCVTVVEEYPGSFGDRPLFYAGLEEWTACFVEFMFLLLGSLFIVIYSLRFMGVSVRKKEKRIVVGV